VLLLGDSRPRCHFTSAANRAGARSLIVSGDKDMMQIGQPRVKILNPQKDNLILDPQRWLKFLRSPEKVDVMACAGCVDNIPGAPGIATRQRGPDCGFGSVRPADRASE